MEQNTPLALPAGQCLVHSAWERSPHHITVTVEGLRELLSHLAAPQNQQGSQGERSALPAAVPSAEGSATPLPCCGYRPKEAGHPHSHPVMWNPWNGVVQCHNCGTVWLPAQVEGTALSSAAPSDGGCATDAERLNWLDETNKRFRMGWKVGVAPAGNASVQSVIQLGGPLTSIRDAIDAAMKERAK